MSVLKSWIKSAGRVPPKDMKDARDEYLQERGLDGRSVRYFAPDHTSITGDVFSSRNWVRLLPENTVKRLQETNNVYSELTDIVSETYKIIQASTNGDLTPSENVQQKLPESVDDIEFEAGHHAYLYDIIVKLFCGDADVNKIRKGWTSVPSEARVEPPDHATVLVEFRNERNMLDVAIFDVIDPDDFFGARYGSSTLMLEAMAQHELEAEAVINNLAFETESTSWAQLDPPEHPIACQTTDHRRRVQFFKIENPKEYYGRAWGNVEEMIQIGNSDTGMEQRELLYDAAIDWRVSLAV
jgi:hypothetical protein